MIAKCPKCGKEIKFNFGVKGIVIEKFEIATICPYCKKELMIQLIPEQEVKIKKKADYIG